MADIEIRSNERESNENVIDLSLDDDVPGNSQNVDKQCSSDDGMLRVSNFMYALQSYLSNLFAIVNIHPKS